MRVLSLFDGMSCGRLALERAGFEVEAYYASEIDKYAMQVAKANYPDTIHIGDVTKVKAADLGRIDFVLGGSPCQGFSFAGKQLNFDDPRSALFFEYVRLVKEVMAANPCAYFLLENVKMKKVYQDVISEHMGVQPIEINSALVSAQNRKRLYWTNIPCVKQPQDKFIFLKDILETNVDEKYYLSDKMLEYFDTRKANFNGGKINIRDVEGKASTITASCASCDISDNFIADITERGYVKLSKDGGLKRFQDKASCLTGGGNSGGNHSDMDVLCVASRGRNPENPTSREAGSPTVQMLEPRYDGKTNCRQTAGKDNLVMQLKPREAKNLRMPFEKAGTLLASMWKGSQSNGMTLVPDLEYRIRRLTPVECERLQTVPDNYTSCVSNTQRYKMLGNGWTIDVIAHILDGLNGII